MLDLDFASQVMAKLQARFRSSLILLLGLVAVPLATATVFYVILKGQYQTLAQQLMTTATESTWQEIGEVRANIHNLHQAWENRRDTQQFSHLGKNFTDLKRTLTLLEKAGESAVLDQRKIQYHLDDLTAYLQNAHKILIILFILVGVITILIVWRTLHRFQWTREYFQQLAQSGEANYDAHGLVWADDAAPTASPADQIALDPNFSPAQAPDLPPLPRTEHDGDELDLAKVIMRGVRRLKKQKAQFVQQNAEHLVLPVDPVAPPDGPAYLRKAMRFKTPLAVLITDPTDLPAAQQVMNYSETGILIRFPHQEIGSLAPGKMVQGRLGTADHFSTFAGKVVRLDVRPNGDLVGIKFISAPW